MSQGLRKQILQSIFLVPLIGLNTFLLFGIYDNLIPGDISAATDINTTKNTVDISKIEVIQKTVQARRIDWDGLEAEILEIIGSEKNKYSFYIENLSTGENIQFNEDQVLHPASVYKVPLALVVLKKVDNGEAKLTDKLLVTSSEKVYSFDPLSKRSGNYEITIEETLTYLIKYSDNTAMTTLEHRLGGVEDLQNEMDELGVGGVTRLPGEATAPAVAKAFRGIYNQKFLSEESNNFLLGLLKNITPEQNDRIPAGVPSGIEVAHKIGTLSTTYQDAGLVYGQDNDYLIVVLNDGVEPSVARDKIRRISAVTYNYLNPVATD